MKYYDNREYEGIALICGSFKGYDQIVSLTDKKLGQYFPKNINKYLVTDGNPIVREFKKIHVNKDFGWNKNLLFLLRQLKEDTVILWIDDLVLKKEINSELLCNQIRYFKEKNLDCLWGYLVPTLFFQILKNKILHKPYYSPKGKYTFSTMCSIYKKKVLIDLLEQTNTPWEFEIQNKRNYKIEVPTDNAYQLSNIVVKGKLLKARLNNFKDNDIKDFPFHGILSEIEYRFRVLASFLISIFR